MPDQCHVSPAGPLVTVVIPACNAAATLAATLAAAACQTHKAIEILIVDDGSTDQTAAIAAGFCAAEPRARLLSQPNRGVAAARNRGILAAKGDYVALLDADDLWHPEKLARQLDAIRRAPVPPGFVYTWCRRIDMAGRVVAQDHQVELHGRAFWRHLYLNVAGNGSAILAPRSALLEAGGFDEGQRAAGLDGNEDWLMQLRIAGTRSIACVPEYLVGYRLTDGAMSADQLKMHQSWLHGAAALARGAPRGLTRVIGWTAARTWFALAVASLRARQPWRAAGFGMRALYGDPLRTFIQLGCSARRLAGRHLCGAPPAFSRPPFLACDPAEELPDQSWPAPQRASWLVRFDHWRLARLGRRDARLPVQAPYSAPAVPVGWHPRLAGCGSLVTPRNGAEPLLRSLAVEAAASRVPEVLEGVAIAILDDRAQIVAAGRGRPPWRHRRRRDQPGPALRAPDHHVAEPFADIGAVEPVHPAADDAAQGFPGEIVNGGFEDEADGRAVGRIHIHRH